MRIVLDSNVLLASISSKSPYYWVWRGFLDQKYTLWITTDILAEYAEVLERNFSRVVATDTLDQIVLSKNITQIIRYFEWNIIKQDPDDNKFFDCAVAANADFIVTQDKHFNIIRSIPFPSVNAIGVVEFKRLLKL